MKKIALILFLLTAIQTGFAQTDYKHQTLTIFKNGLVYLEKTTEIEVKSKEATLYPLPFSTNANLPIVMGSLQLKTDQNTINELNYTRKNLGKSKDQYYDNLPSLFKNNIGAKISVSTREKTVDGVLKNIILDMLDLQQSLI